MKKVWIMLVVLMLAVSITGCTKEKDVGGGSSSSDSNISENIPQPQDKPDNITDDDDSEQAGTDLGAATEETEGFDGAGN